MIPPSACTIESQKLQAPDSIIKEALNKQYQFLTSIIDVVADPIIIIGTDFKVKFANKAACNFTRDNACLHVTEPSCHKLIFDSDTPCPKADKPCPLIMVLENDKTTTIESEHTMPDGEKRFFKLQASPLYDTDGDLLGIVESYHDITERNKYIAILQESQQELEKKVTERTEELLESNKILGKHIAKRQKMDKILRTERDKFHSMLMAIKQGMHIINADYEIEFQNDVLIEVFGDKIGHKCYEVYSQRNKPCKSCPMTKALQTNTLQRAEELTFKGRTFSRSYSPFQDIEGKTKCLTLFSDITEEQAYQAKKIRTSQLASIGELSAGVAHEINNPINGIINYAQILLDDKGHDEHYTSILDQIISEGERIADIVSKLLAFTRQDDDDNTTFSETYINEVLDNSFTLFRHQLVKDGIVIAQDIQEDTPAVLAHPQKLEQVFINLLSNARYALNEKYQGKHDDKRLEIKAQTVEMAGTSYVRISFKDYGIGIPAEIIDSVCNPFFSTKAAGEGTGLGLSISRGLIKNFNGFLRIKSEPGEYTNIMVDLPVTTVKAPTRYKND